MIQFSKVGRIRGKEAEKGWSAEASADPRPQVSRTQKAAVNRIKRPRWHDVISQGKRRVSGLNILTKTMPLFINRDQIFAHQVHLLEQKLRVRMYLLLWE